MPAMMDDRAALMADEFLSAPVAVWIMVAFAAVTPATAAELVTLATAELMAALSVANAELMAALFVATAGIR